MRRYGGVGGLPFDRLRANGCGAGGHKGRPYGFPPSGGTGDSRIAPTVSAVYGAVRRDWRTVSRTSGVMGPTYLRTMLPRGSMKYFSGMPVRP